MVNEKVKEPMGIPPDKPKRSASLEPSPHRSKKRSFSATILTKGGGTRGQSREESEAARLLTRASIQSKSTTSQRQSDSAHLLKLIPDLSQKEVSRLVAALIKRQKREAAASTKRRERTSTRSIPALFPEKHGAQRISSHEAAKNQRENQPMPARATAFTKEDALRMLQEAEAHENSTMDFTQRHPSTTARSKQQLDLAEDLIRHSTPRYEILRVICKFGNIINSSANNLYTL